MTDAVRDMMTVTLEHKGFEVVAAANVPDALRLIATDTFDALITDLRMPNPSDGFTVVSAMRHSQPDALTLLVSGYPDVAKRHGRHPSGTDEIIVKPFEVGRLADLLREKMSTRKPAARIEKQRVAAILQRCMPGVVDDWSGRAKQAKELNHLQLSDEERTGHLPKLVEDLIVRLRKAGTNTKDSDAVFSTSALAHGKLRFLQGYTPRCWYMNRESSK